MYHGNIATYLFTLRNSYTTSWQTAQEQSGHNYEYVHYASLHFAIDMWEVHDLAISGVPVQKIKFQHKIFVKFRTISGHFFADKKAKNALCHKNIFGVNLFITEINNNIIWRHINLYWNNKYFLKAASSSPLLAAPILHCLSFIFQTINLFFVQLMSV